MFTKTNKENQSRMDEGHDLREFAHNKSRDLHNEMNIANRRHHDERSALEEEIMELTADRNKQLIYL